MDALKEALIQKEQLSAAVRHKKENLEAAPGKDKARISNDLRILRGMYKDACAEVERLRPPKAKTHGQRMSVVSMEAYGGEGLTFDRLERSGMVWADMEGCTWGEFEQISGAMVDGKNAKKTLDDLLPRAFSTLTDRQREVFGLYHMGGLSVVEIAEKLGVNKATVSRTLRAGEKRVMNYIYARLYIAECIDPQSKRLDYLKFAANTDILSDWHRETLYYLLTLDAQLTDIAEHLNLARSTISRRAGRVGAALEAGGPSLDPDVATYRPRKGEWRDRGETQAKLGLSRASHYKSIREPVGELTRYRYELLRCREQGRTAEETASYMGVSVLAVRRTWSRHPGQVDVTAVPADGYDPERVREERPELRRLLASSQQYRR